MMNSTPLITLNLTCEQALELVSSRLQSAGLQVMRTFDLHNTQSFADGCLCPHHGTEACDCQMMILLVYAGGQKPASMLVHSFQESTWLYLVDTPEQPVDRKLEMLIQESLCMPTPTILENTNPGDTHEHA
jgi:hypothetical protein